MLPMPFAMGPLPRCQASGAGTSRLRIQTSGWHKEQAPPAGSYDGLERKIKTACDGLNITPDQLHQELEEGGDLPDLVSGALTPKALRLTAKALALMRYSPENERPLNLQEKYRQCLSGIRPESLKALAISVRSTKLNRTPHSALTGNDFKNYPRKEDLIGCFDAMNELHTWLGAENSKS
jgi:hypothetical protein